MQQCLSMCMYVYIELLSHTDIIRKRQKDCMYMSFQQGNTMQNVLQVFRTLLDQLLYMCRSSPIALLFFHSIKISLLYVKTRISSPLRS